MDDEELPQAGETILLRPIYAFGFHGIPGHKAQLVCIEENTVAYAVGCNLVVHSLSTMIMQFLQSSSSIQKIIAVAASPNRQIIAICETTKSGHGQITVVDTKKLRKMQKFTSGSVTEFEVCALTQHGERLIAATKDQRASLICWDIQHEKVIGNIAVYKEITHVTANPHDNDLFASSGPTHFRLWSLKGGYLQNIVIQGLEHFEDDKFTITDHVWLPDGAIAIAVAEEMIFIVRDGALQTKLVDAGHTTCFACSRKGFFAGDNDGTLKEFIITAKAGEPPIYTKHTRIRLNGPISWIAVPPDRAETAYIVQGEKVLKVSFKGEESQGTNASEDHVEASELHAFHFGAVTGMDVCVHRKLLAICKDKLIRLWRYPQFICQIAHICEEEPRCILLSPWGYQILAGMAKCITVFRIMAYKLEHYKDILLPACGQVKFSPSGHLVAASTGRDIIILSPFTWDVIGTLKGHLGTVSTLAWSANSIYLVSGGLDGAIYTWSMDKFHRSEECVTKGSRFSSIIFDPDRTFLYACGSSLPLRIISTNEKPPGAITEVVPKRALSEVGQNHQLNRASILWELNQQSPYKLLAGLFRKRMLFAATQEEDMHVYMYPITSNTATPVTKFSPRAGPISQLCVDENSSLIFIRSLSGAIFIYMLGDNFEEMKAHKKRDDEDECVLISMLDLDAIKKEFEEVKDNLQKEESHSNFKQEQVRQAWMQKMKEKEKEHAYRETSLKHELSMLSDKLENYKKNMEDTLQGIIQSQQQSENEIYNHFENKFSTETSKTQYWKVEAEKTKELCDEMIAKKEEEHNSHVQKLYEEMKIAELEANKKIQDFEAQCNKQIREYETYMEEDLLINDEELDTAVNRMRLEVKRQEERADEASSKMLLEKKTATTLQLQISELKTASTAQESSLRLLETENARLENIVVEIDYKKQILDTLVEETDAHRKALMHATREKETQSILQDIKIKQWQERQKPLQDEINQLHGKIQEMHTREALDAAAKFKEDEHIRVLKERVLDQQERLIRFHKEIRSRDQYIDAFREALAVIVQDHAPGEWPQLIEGLFLAYVKDSHRAAVAQGLESRAEIMRQRDTLENFVAMLKSCMKRTDERCMEEIKHITIQNLQLLHDFSSANRNVRRMAFIVQKLQGQLEYYRGIISKQKVIIHKIRRDTSTLQRSPSRLYNPKKQSASITMELERQLRFTQITLPDEMNVSVPEIVTPFSRYSIKHSEYDGLKAFVATQGKKDPSKEQLEASNKELNEKLGDALLQIKTRDAEIRRIQSILDKKSEESSKFQMRRPTTIRRAKSAMATRSPSTIRKSPILQTHTDMSAEPSHPTHPWK